MDGPKALEVALATERLQPTRTIEDALFFTLRDFTYQIIWHYILMTYNLKSLYFDTDSLISLTALWEFTKDLP